MPGADGMSAKFMKNAFVGWTFTAGLYYPPDFDASKLVPMKQLKPKGHQKDQALNIRMMFPFTMICDECGEYNYTGTKFTSKVEQIKHESYLGLKVYRFYGRCKHCWAEFTFKTDPKNSDYTMESGGKRTYEAWKDADMMEAQMRKEKEDEKTEQMKALEQKSIDVAAEMQRLEDLDAIRALNKRLGSRDQSIESALQYLFTKHEGEDSAEKALTYGESEELAGFREAQLEEKRRKLDEEVEADDKPDVGAIASSSSSSSAGVGAAASSSASGPGGSSTTSTPVTGTARLIAAAVEERASSSSARSSVGARFTVVKRKAVPEAGDDASSCSAAKRPCGTAGIGAADADAAGVAAAHVQSSEAACGSASATASGVGGAASASGSAVPAGGAGGLAGLGAYDSDSS